MQFRKIIAFNSCYQKCTFSKFRQSAQLCFSSFFFKFATVTTFEVNFKYDFKYYQIAHKKLQEKLFRIQIILTSILTFTVIIVKIYESVLLNAAWIMLKCVQFKCK